MTRAAWLTRSTCSVAKALSRPITFSICAIISTRISRRNGPPISPGVYLAGALHILRKEDEAGKLIARYRIGQHDPAQITDFYQPLGADAQYIAILAREFPARLKKLSGAEFEKVLKPISEGSFNTLSAAYAVLALKSYSQIVAQQPPELTIAEIDKAKREKRLTSGTKLLQRTDFSSEAAALRFRSAKPLSPPGAFFQVIEAGFDRQIPNKALSDGLEIYRELLDKSDKPVTRTQLGDVITVRLRVRSLRPESVTNVAVVDLLPGGFEIVGTSLVAGRLIDQRRGLRRGPRRSRGVFRDDSNRDARDHLPDQIV